MSSEPVRDSAPATWPEPAVHRGLRRRRYATMTTPPGLQATGPWLRPLLTVAVLRDLAHVGVGDVRGRRRTVDAVVWGQPVCGPHYQHIAATTAVDSLLSRRP
jgi:hypothetical protein